MSVDPSLLPPPNPPIDPSPPTINRPTDPSPPPINPLIDPSPLPPPPPNPPIDQSLTQLIDRIPVPGNDY